MRPIMLTTVTTIMGLVPMALTVNLNFFAQTITVGSITAIWWVQLSTAIISGLAFSTLLTLVLIPVMLTLPTNIVNLFTTKKSVASATQSTTIETEIEEPLDTISDEIDEAVEEIIEGQAPVEITLDEGDKKSNVTPINKKSKSVKKQKSDKSKVPPSDDLLEAAE